MGAVGRAKIRLIQAMIRVEPPINLSIENIMKIANKISG
jgi:hypothetical protein